MADGESFKTGAPNFFYFFMAQAKCAQHQLPGDNKNIILSI